MNMEVLATYFIAFCLLVGAIFILIGAIGLVRFKDPMARLHAPTKVGTVGVGALLLASIFHSELFGKGWSMNEMLIMAFLFVTAPISAHFMAKVSMHRETCETPPSLPGEKKWSTFNVPPEDVDVVETS